MKLIKLHDDVFVDPDDITSIQAEVVSKYCSSSISDNSVCETFNGSIVTLKNGRKIAIDKVSPSQLMDILNSNDNCSEAIIPQVKALPPKNQQES